MSGSREVMKGHRTAGACSDDDDICTE